MIFTCRYLPRTLTRGPSSANVDSEGARSQGKVSAPPATSVAAAAAVLTFAQAFPSLPSFPALLPSCRRLYPSHSYPFHIDTAFTGSLFFPNWLALAWLAGRLA